MSIKNENTTGSRSNESTPAEPSMKLRTARTLKWNTIDRVASQLLYAVTGIVLANVLSKEDFGLVGALLVFQAFAMLFVDSGFGAALLQKKDPSQRDYSTVFWFNILISAIVYAILWCAAPVIAEIFHDSRLVLLSKVMFFSFIINGLAIVQTNRLMKRMDVKQIAIANSIGLLISGIIGIWSALSGFGAWALIWQTLSLAIVKTSWLWITGHWLPSAVFSIKSLRHILPVGTSVFTSSLLNTICLNIYNFAIGAFYDLRSLGIYTQADKWSKMGSASLSQIMTSSFVPLLSRFQDSRYDFHRYMKRINRFAAFITLPALGGLAIVGAPLFHTLFGNKWDAAIPLFQILCARGIFIVLISLYNNYLLALGRSRALIVVELTKDLLLLAAIAATILSGNLTTLIWGQFAASAITYIIVLAITSRATQYPWQRMLADLLPFTSASSVMCLACLAILALHLPSFLMLILQLLCGTIIYTVIMRLARFPELTEATAYLLGRFRRQNTKKNQQPNHL